MCLRKPLTAYRVRELKSIIKRKRIKDRISSLNLRYGDKVKIRAYFAIDRKNITIIGYFKDYKNGKLNLIKPVTMGRGFFRYIPEYALCPKSIDKL